MLIRYLGHSCFYLKSDKGSTIIIDPYGEQLKYDFPQNLAADIVVQSHEHRDHNASWRVGGNPSVVKRTHGFPVEFETPVKRTGEVFTFVGTPSFHDDASGRRRGPNTIFHFDLGGMRMVHLGDLGHLLTDAQIRVLGRTDVLFLPVGGGIVLNSKEAALVVNQLTPRLILPMHYLTPEIEGLDLAEEPVESFLERMDNVEDARTTATDITVNDLPFRTLVRVLSYK